MTVWLTRACRRITLNLTFCHYTNQTVPSFRFSTYQQNHQSKVWGFDSFLVPFSTLTSIRRIRKRSTIKSSVKKKKIHLQAGSSLVPRAVSFKKQELWEREWGGYWKQEREFEGTPRAHALSLNFLFKFSWELRRAFTLVQLSFSKSCRLSVLLHFLLHGAHFRWKSRKSNFAKWSKLSLEIKKRRK